MAPQRPSPTLNQHGSTINQQESTIDQPGSTSDDAEMHMDVDPSSLDRSTFIMAPSTISKPPLVSTTLKRPTSVLYFPEVIESNGNQSIITGLDVDKWLLKHKITTPDEIRKARWNEKRYWRVLLSAAMYENAKEAARSGSSHAAVAPQWDESEDQTVGTDTNSATPPLDFEKVFEKFFMTGLAPGNTTITNESMKLNIQGLLETHELNYSKDISIGWNKAKTERLAIVNLEKGSTARISELNANGLFLFSNQVQLCPLNNNFKEKRQQQDIATLALFGIPYYVTGKDLDGIRQQLGATAVKIPGFRDPKSGTLHKSTQAHFIFNDRKEAISKSGEQLIINSQPYYLRLLLTNEGKRNNCCYSCGSESHIKPNCPKTKAKEVKKNQQLSAFLENKMTPQQSKAFAQRLSTSIALGESPLPNNYAAYSLAAKKGVLVDPESLKKSGSSTPKASYANILGGSMKVNKAAATKSVPGTTKTLPPAGPPSGINLLDPPSGSNQSDPSTNTSGLTVEAKFAELEAKINLTVEELKKENEDFKKSLGEYMQRLEDNISNNLLESVEKLFNKQMVAVNELRRMISNVTTVQNQLKTRMDDMEIKTSFLEDPTESAPSTPGSNKRRILETPLASQIEQGSAKRGGK
jgi:hypothetical protein